jgi:hypothetical protein
MKVSLKKLVEKIRSFVYSIISEILFIILFIFAIYLIPPLLNREYEFVLRVAEFAIIGSGTLAILTFTYAAAIEHGNDKEKHDAVILSGEDLLKSTLTFIIGIGFLPTVGLLFKNPSQLSKYFGMFSASYDALGIIVAIIILVIGESSLLVSAYFLSKGIVKLGEVLKLVEK